MFQMLLSPESRLPNHPSQENIESRAALSAKRHHFVAMDAMKASPGYQLRVKFVYQNRQNNPAAVDA